MWLHDDVVNKAKQVISTHTSRVGCDGSGCNAWRCSQHFYSHIPCGMWRTLRTIYHHTRQFLLTHPVWDVTLQHGKLEYIIDISTHTSRVGCDARYFDDEELNNISTHTSRVGCDGANIMADIDVVFLLTHPVWDVTAIYSIFQSHYSHILQDGPIIHLELY